MGLPVRNVKSLSPMTDCVIYDRADGDWLTSNGTWLSLLFEAEHFSSVGSAQAKIDEIDPEKWLRHRLVVIPYARYFKTEEAPVTEHIMQFFAYDLPERLQAISKPFCDLAKWVVETLPRNPERTVALRELLNAKDAAVRAALAVDLQ